jgi:hypothetical protein
MATSAATSPRPSRARCRRAAAGNHRQRRPEARTLDGERAHRRRRPTDRRTGARPALTVWDMNGRRISRMRRRSMQRGIPMSRTGMLRQLKRSVRTMLSSARQRHDLGQMTRVFKALRRRCLARDARRTGGGGTADPRAAISTPYPRAGNLEMAPLFRDLPSLPQPFVGGQHHSSRSASTAPASACGGTLGDDAQIHGVDIQPDCRSMGCEYQHSYRRPG